MVHGIAVASRVRGAQLFKCRLEPAGDWQVRQTEETTDAEVWRADARCLAGGRESDDVLFFRVKPSRLEMRVRISDSDPEELVRCPMQT